MDKTYFVQRETMSKIADEVRTLSGDNLLMSPDLMQAELIDANDAVTEQDSLMDEIRDVLSCKRIPDETLEGLDEYVDFYDYDGTLLHRYTVLEIMGMDELPPLPSHDGLICQGWNWTLEQLKEEQKSTIVAPYYCTDDNSLRIYITIPYDDFTINMIDMISIHSTSGYIDWGDGVIDAATTSGRKSHTYEKAGKYRIRIEKKTTYNVSLSSHNAVLFCKGNTAVDIRSIVDAMELPDKIAGLNYTRQCVNMKTITLPKGFSTGEKCFYWCRQLRLSIFTGNSLDVNYGASNCIVSCVPDVYSIRRDSFNGVKRVELPRFSRSEYSQGTYIDATDPSPLARIPTKKADLRLYSFSSNGTIAGNSALEDIRCRNIPFTFLQSSQHLKKVVIEKASTLANGAFSNSTVKDVTFVDCNIKTLGAVFNDCKCLTKIKLPDGLETMISTFSVCYALESIVLPNSLIEIGSSAFYFCQKLNNVILPENLKIIGQNAFCECTCIDKLVLPESLTQIGSKAFSKTSVRELVIPKNVESVYVDAFDVPGSVIKFTNHTFVPTLPSVSSSFLSSGVTIMVPETLYEEWKNATNWSVIRSIIVPV